MSPLCRCVPSLPLLAALLSLAACGAPAVPNLDNPGTTIVCFGDSITAGVGAPQAAGYPARLEGLLGVEVLAAGVPGDTSRDGLARLDGVLALDPWLVIVELGGNDLLRRRPVEVVETDLAAIVERLLAAGVAVVLVEVEAPLVGRRYGAMFRRLARRFGVPLVDDVLGGILADPGRKSDRIHPNAAGYRDLARGVAEVVEPLVEERRRLGLPVERLRGAA